MSLLETGYFVAVAGVVLSGFIMTALAIDAYWKTERPAMIHLTVGFVLIVAAAAGTALDAVASDFTYVRAHLLANSGFTALGYLFVVYSLWSYRTSEIRVRNIPGVEYLSSRLGRFFH